MAERTLAAETTHETIAGLRVRVADRGGAPADARDLPVVVLHGWGAHLEAVEPIVAGLEPVLRVVALDLPGFGRSDPPPSPWATRDFAEFVLQVLAAKGIGRFRVVGHSHGGRIAIWLAANHPDRVDRVLLCDAAGLRPRRTFAYRRRVALAKAGRVIGRLGGAPGRRLQDRMRRRVASADYLAASGTVRDSFRLVVAEDLGDHLPRIQAPTLLVWGSEDDDTPLWMAERMHALIPDSGLVVFEGAGHYSYADEPGRFAAVARTFLFEQPRGRG